jgi:peptidylprolyl isomerase
MSRVSTWSVAVLALAALGLAGCSSSSSSTTTTTTTAGTPTTSRNSVTVATIPVKDRSPAGTSGTAPTIEVPPGAPPTRLEETDLIVGTGAVAKPGDTVTVQYVLATYSTGKEIQSSWTSQPFSFVLDASPEQVIPGWDEGVVGMRVGGRRELIIPPALAYGNKVPPGSSGIAADDTLVFIVDLLNIS